MVMARSDVACASGTIWALQSWLRWRRTAGWRWAGLHVLALVVALGSKETAVVLAPLLTVAAFFRRDRRPEAAVPNVGEAEGRRGETAGPTARESAPESRQRGVLDRSGWWARLLWIAPVWALTALYLVFRRVLLGPAAALTVDFDPLRIFLAGGRYLWGILPLRLESQIEPIARDPWLDPLVPATALLGWALYAAVMVFLWRRRCGQGLVLALLVPLSLAPVLLVSELNVPVAASRYALADRWVLLAIAAGTVLLALVGTWLGRRLVSYGIGLATALWVVATLGFSSRSHAAYRDTDTLAAFQDARYQAMPERLRTLEDRCDHVERRMHQALRERAPDGALVESRGLPAGCPHAGRFSLLRLVALTQLGRFSEASAMAAALEGERLEPRHHGQAAYHAGLAHAELGDLPRAETELRQASRLGYPSCNLPAQLGRLLARRNQLQPAAQEYERAAACSPGDPRPLLAAASLWAAAAQRARARRPSPGSIGMRCHRRYARPTIAEGSDESRRPLRSSFQTPHSVLLPGVPGRRDRKGGVHSKDVGMAGPEAGVHSRDDWRSKGPRKRRAFAMGMAGVGMSFVCSRSRRELVGPARACAVVASVA